MFLTGGACCICAFIGCYIFLNPLLSYVPVVELTVLITVAFALIGFMLGRWLPTGAE
jgi:hypothetical protein